MKDKTEADKKEKYTVQSYEILTDRMNGQNAQRWAPKNDMSVNAFKFLGSFNCK